MTTGAQPIPQPRWRLPLVGDLLSIDVAKPVQREMQMAQELGGIFERKILQHRLIVVSGADLVREVNDEEKWAKFLGADPTVRLRSGIGLRTRRSRGDHVEAPWPTGAALPRLIRRVAPARGTAVGSSTGAD